MIGVVIVLSVGVNRDKISSMQVFTQIISIIIHISYYVYFNGKYGATLGKMAIGARIVNSDGTPISYAKAFGRFFAEILSGLILGIGYIMAAFDDKKRALHDQICNTLVVNKG